MTLPETIGLYQGLTLQMMLRLSALRWVPYLVTVIGGLIILTRRGKAGSPLAVMEGSTYVALGLYAAWVLLLLALFWPEASRFGRGHRLDSTQVASYVASQDAQATIQTAADTQEVSTEPVLETPGFRLMLKFLIDTPLSLARSLNPATHQAFRPLESMSWYLGLSLTAEASRSLTDWVEGCYKPVMTTDQEFQDAITSRDLLPWGDGPVAQALATRDTIPGAATGGRYLRTARPLGTLFLANPDSPRTVRCNIYLRAVELDVQRWLFETRSPNGTPLSQVFYEDFGRTVEEQAHWLIYRDILVALGRPAPVPSLTGTYGALTGVTLLGGALQGAARQTSGGILGGLWGALMGSANAGLNQFSQIVSALTWAVSLAMWFLYWAPSIFGQALMLLVGLFPIALLYMLVPYAGFRPLLMYFLALLYVCCSPLWFALVDLWARAMSATAPQSADPLVALFNWAPQQVYAAQAIVTGLVLVFSLGAAILFFSTRALVSLLRP